MTATLTEQHAWADLYTALERESTPDTRPRYELCVDGEKVWTTTQNADMGYLALFALAHGHTVTILRATYHPGTRTWSREQVFCETA